MEIFRSKELEIPLILQILTIYLQQRASSYSINSTKIINAHQPSEILTSQLICLADKYRPLPRKNTPMHPIINSYLESFSKNYELGDLKVEDQFERFINYIFITNRCPNKFEIEDVTTNPPEVGIDGAAIMIADQIIKSDQEAIDIFAKRTRDVEIKYFSSNQKQLQDLKEIQY